MTEAPNLFADGKAAGAGLPAKNSSTGLMHRKI
jgi:hypothetical protein